MATGTIPMLIIAGIPFIPAGPMLTNELDPNLDCGPVIQKLAPLFVPAADVKFPCVLVEPDCGGKGNPKCRGGEWVK